MTPDPVDLHVLVSRQKQNRYVVNMQLRRPGASTPSDPLGGKRPIMMIDEVEALALTGRPEQLGTYLGHALLDAPGVRAAWEWCRGVAEGVDPPRPLRLRLELDDALQHLAWEALDLPGLGPVALSERILFSRYLPARKLGAPPPRRGALRAALAVAAPDDLQQRYDLARPDVDALLAPVAANLPGVAVNRIQGSQEALLKSLRGGGDIVYLACHGRFSSKGPALLLEDSDGHPDWVDGAELVAAIGRLPSLPQLVVLVSCESAGDGESTDVALTLGPRLVRAGVPAVVAMQGDLSMETAAIFFPPFFESLLRDGFVDQAMAVGRQAAHRRDRPDATVPLLFMRSVSGRLFVEDPVLQTQVAMAKADALALFASNRYIPLPIDVIAVGEQQSIAVLEETGGLETSARDLARVVDEILTQPAQARPRIHFLVGSYGTNRTTQMRRIVWDVLQRADTQRLPVYIDLRDYPRARRGARDPILHLIYAALSDYWPGLTKQTVSDLLRAGPRLHLLFDRSDTLPDAERKRAWESIALFSAASENKHWRHDYVITAVPPSELSLPGPFDVARPGIDVTRLYLQPLAQRNLRRFLHHWTKDKGMPGLYEYLVRARLTDLVTLPFMMVRFLLRAMLDELAPSRAVFIQELLADGLIKLADKPSMASHAMPFLKTLAWEMRRAGAVSWPLDDVFGLLARVRGQREYSMTRFLETLIDAEILTRVGPEEIGFSYPAVHSYCCALAISERKDWEQTVHEIVITLGSEGRRQRWSETLVFLASIFGDAPSDFTSLLYKIVDDVDLFHGDLVFLTARCLMQGRQLLGKEDKGKGNKETVEGVFVRDLEHQIIDALALRLDPQFESRLGRQEQATELLGQLAYMTPKLVVPILVQTANRRVRLSASGSADFHFSNVRFAAFVALEQLLQSVHGRADETIRHQSLSGALDALEKEMTIHLAIGDSELVNVLDAWAEPSDSGLLREHFLTHVQGVAPDVTPARDVAGLAAMALGDLTNRQRTGAVEVAPEDEMIVKFLGEKLLNLSPTTHDPTLWAITHALAMGPVAPVQAHVIEPFVRQDLKQKDSDDPVMLQRHKYMAYLVGRLRLRSEGVYDFLRVRCLHHLSDMRLWVSVIDALGLIADGDRTQHLPLLTDLALGRLDELFPGAPFSLREMLYARRRAFGVLGEIGGRAVLTQLRLVNDIPPELLPDMHRVRQRIMLRLEKKRREPAVESGRHG